MYKVLHATPEKDSYSRYCFHVISIMMSNNILYIFIISCQYNIRSNNQIVKQKHNLNLTQL